MTEVTANYDESWKGAIAEYFRQFLAAAAVAANVKVIVTFNLKHFPENSLSPWGIQAKHPDVFLTTLYEQFTDTLINIIQQQPAALKNPPVSVT